MLTLFQVCGKLSVHKVNLQIKIRVQSEEFGSNLQSSFVGNVQNLRELQRNKRYQQCFHLTEVTHDILQQMCCTRYSPPF